MKLRLRENFLKVYDFASCFYLNVNEYLIEWLCGLKANRNKQKTASGHLQLYRKFYIILEIHA